jgi:hypothetical protein
VEAVVSETLPVTSEDIPVLYAMMRQQRLLGRVVRGDESLAAFEGIAAASRLFMERLPGGETAGFWWVTPFYATACCFHFCLFKPHRRMAEALFRKVAAQLFGLGITELFLCVPRRNRELARLLPSMGFPRVTTISKEITVWVATSA